MQRNHAVDLIFESDGLFPNVSKLLSASDVFILESSLEKSFGIFSTVNLVYQVRYKYGYTHKKFAREQHFGSRFVDLSFLKTAITSSASLLHEQKIGATGFEESFMIDWGQFNRFICYELGIVRLNLSVQLSSKIISTKKKLVEERSVVE